MPGSSPTLLTLPIFLPFNPVSQDIIDLRLVDKPYDIDIHPALNLLNNISTITPYPILLDSLIVLKPSVCHLSPYIRPLIYHLIVQHASPP
jgi:hypothetical protein